MVQCALLVPTVLRLATGPETPGVYTFEGYIREAKVYKFDPLQAAKDLLDPCCNCRPALDRTVAGPAACQRLHGSEGARAGHGHAELCAVGRPAQLG